jgi:hypothetical protein
MFDLSQGGAKASPKAAPQKTTAAEVSTAAPSFLLTSLRADRFK